MNHQRGMRALSVLGLLLAAALQAGCLEEDNRSTSTPVMGPVPAPQSSNPVPGDTLTSGYDAAARRITSPVVVLDLARPAAGNYPTRLTGPGFPGMVRAASHEVVASGGYFGRGFSRFRPGHVADGNRGKHDSGIGQIHGFQDTGDSSRMVTGLLIRFGTTFFEDQAGASAADGGIGALVLVNDTGRRPMLITRGGHTRVFGSCDEDLCNTTENASVIDGLNERGNQPDLNRYTGQWLWVEFQFNANAPAFTRTRLWSEDGTLQGAEIIAPWASPGRVTTLDIIGYVNSIADPGAQAYYDLERVEFRVGSDTSITPPTGFPGSAR